MGSNKGAASVEAENDSTSHLGIKATDREIRIAVEVKGVVFYVKCTRLTESIGLGPGVVSVPRPPPARTRGVSERKYARRIVNGIVICHSQVSQHTFTAVTVGLIVIWSILIWWELVPIEM